MELRVINTSRIVGPRQHGIAIRDVRNPKAMLQASFTVEVGVKLSMAASARVI